MNLLGISGTIVGSKSLVLTKKVLEEIKNSDPSLEPRLLDLKQFDVQFCDGRDPSTYTDDTKKVIEIVSSADMIIITTPIFQGSITGVLKNLFDLLPVDALRHKVIGMAAVGGTYQHYLVLENQLRPILGYFRAFVAPGHVYAHNDHFNETNEIVDLEVLRRIKNLADELLLMKVLVETKQQNIIK